MIFTRLKFKNLYSFAEAEINLSFPRKLSISPLDDEHLFGRPKFYYRKVCIVTGSNASGKTSLGRILWGIQLFLANKSLHPAAFAVEDRMKRASFEADFATDDFRHHRIFVSFEIDKTGTFLINEVNYVNVFIGENDSCIKTTKRLDEFFLIENREKAQRYFYSVAADGYSASLEQFKKDKFHGGWYYLLSETKETNDELLDLNKDILDKIIKTFDPSVKSVHELRESSDDNDENNNKLTGYSIRFLNGDNVIVTTSGDVANCERLSKGTFEAVKLSHFISSLEYVEGVNENKINGLCEMYFLDERMAYVHSELERAIIALIISKLKVNSQFFYTTHNSDIFKLDLPVHSYIFIKKENAHSFFIDASSILKKNDRNLAKYVENDVFRTLPDMSLIEGLL